MEILSDAVFKGNVSISGGNFSVTLKGESVPLLQTKKDQYGNSLLINASEFVENTNISNDAHIFGNAFIDGHLHVDRYISLKNGDSITNWSDLCVHLGSHFAPSTISDTVNLNTRRIDSVCTTVSSLPKFCRVTLDFDVPADCTKFLIETNTYSTEEPYYMFMTKGHNPVSVVNVDLESRCDSTTDMRWKFIATKSSGFAMNASDEYKLGYFYKC